jgi:type IV secretion system protein TrbI
MDNSQFNPGDPQDSRSPEKAKTGVRRVNNMPLIIVCGVVLVFVVLVVLVAMDRAARVRDSSKNDMQGQVDKGLADQVLGASGGRTGGLVGAGDDGSLPIAKVDNLDLPPPPPEVKEDPELARIYAAKLALFEKAMSAGSQVLENKNAQAAAGAATPGSDPGTGVVQNQDASRRERRLDNEDESAQRGKGDYRQFDKFKDGDRWLLGESIQAPRSHYELRAGFMIPGIMLTGVNSELPGQIIGQVSQDVYDTATGKYKLIPQGTRLVGVYDSKVQYGQSRVLIAWQRLVFPDGKAMDIGSMPGSDSAGYSGFKDKVNNHYVRIFGSALLLSGIVAGVNTSQTNPGNDPFGSSTNTILSQAIAQEVGQTASNLLNKNINISPTIEIRPGYRFNVMVVKDLDFDKPYQPFDY